MLSHPNPHASILLPYMNPNLAQQARVWMAGILLGEHLPLLPPAPQERRERHKHLRMESLPSEIIPWSNSQANIISDQAYYAQTIQQRDGTNRVETPIDHYSTIGSVMTPEIVTLPKRNFHQLCKASPVEKPTQATQYKPKKNPTSSKAILPSTASKNRAHKLTKRKELQPPTQKTLFDTNHIIGNPGHYIKDDIWGHCPDEIDQNSIFRLLLQNPRSLNLFTSNIEVQYSLAISQDLGISALCMPETNINWGHKQAHSTFHSTLKKTWQHCSYSVSYTEENFTTRNQPGGMAAIIANKWVSRIKEKGLDPFGMGHWNYFTLRGANEKRVTLIPAFRVCSQTLSACGQTMATAQQHRELSRKFQQEGNANDDPRPRLQFIIDLQAWIQHIQSKGHDIILALDANEDTSGRIGKHSPVNCQLHSPIKCPAHDGLLSMLITSCCLADPLTWQHSTHKLQRTVQNRLYPSLSTLIACSNQNRYSSIWQGFLKWPPGVLYWFQCQNAFWKWNSDNTKGSQ